jgi:AraC-like DNA-binding protein
MTNRVRNAAMVPVQRTALATRDIELIRELISGLYAEHQARTRPIKGVEPDASMRGAMAGVLSAGVISTPGIEYMAGLIDTASHPMGVVVLEGNGELTDGRVLHRYNRGEGFMAPEGPFAARMCGGSVALLQIPRSAAAAMAEESTGLPAADLRFTAVAPVSRAAGARWVRTVRFGCQQLIDSRLTEMEPLIAAELSRLVTAAFLETFPNTAMTVTYLPAPGWAAPVAVRRAAAFIDGYADRPVTMAEIAEAAGVTARALQYAFRRHYDTTPSGYLRRVRLERAHLELSDAEPGDGVTVTAIARRWGWASPSQFSVAYRQRFGFPPGRTLRG